MTDEAPAPGTVPAAFTSNGHGPAARTAAALEALPQMLYQAVATALSQVPVTTRHLPCTTCVLARLTWASDHSAEITAAEGALKAAAAEQEAKDPADRVQLDAMSFLPERLRPGGDQAAPALQDGTVLAGGTLYCLQHVPNAPGQPGKRPFLIAQGALSSQMLAEIRGQAA
jgi:hypothetical protein